MATKKYRKTSPFTWNDAKFKKLSNPPSAVTTWFYLMTHQHLTAIGAMLATPAGLAAELGWPEKAFRKAFKEVTDQGMAKVSEKDSIIWLPNFMKHNKPESPNVLKSWVPSFDYLPECPLKAEILQHLKVFVEGLSKGFQEAFKEAFAEALAHPLPNQEQEQEQEQDTPHSPPSISNNLPISVSNYLAGLLKKNIFNYKPNHKPISDNQLQTWAEEIDRMIRIDGRSPERIYQAVIWLFTDNLKNEAQFAVFSAGSLREKFDRIEVQIARRDIPIDDREFYESLKSMKAVIDEDD